MINCGEWLQKIFNWVGRERVTLGEATRRLRNIGQLTRTGQTDWNRRTVAQILGNPTYKGMAAFGKTRCGPIRSRLRPIRCKEGHSKQSYSVYEVPKEEWIYISVPALIDEILFEAVQEQLQENKKRVRERKEGAKYLLQSLIVCSHCGYAFYGIRRKSTRKKESVSEDYIYYRCIGLDKIRFANERICCNKQIRGDLLENAVWDEVKNLLKNPDIVLSEHQRRLDEISNTSDDKKDFLKQKVSKLKKGISRLIDAYSEGHIEKQEFEIRIKSIKQRLASSEEQIQKQKDHHLMEAELKLIIGKIEDFAKLVTTGLEEADWSMKRNIIRSLVKRIEAGSERINVVFRIGDTLSNPNSQSENVLQHCSRRCSRKPSKIPGNY